MSGYRFTPERENQWTKNYYSADVKALNCYEKIINDLVCGYYSKENALGCYSINAYQLIAWMRTLGLSSRLKPNKNQVVEPKLTPQEEIKHLKDQLKQTQKILSDTQIMNSYYGQVIEVAEREFRIEIEKKFDTKQSKK